MTINDPNFIAKLKFYKTVYSPLDKKYVKIEKFRIVRDRIVIHAKVEGKSFLFSKEELLNYAI
jgi:hypothetical protein